MKKSTSLILLVAILAALIFGYFFISYNSSKNKKNSENKLNIVSIKDISKINVTNNSGTFTLEKTSNSWKISGKDYKIDPSMTNSFLKQFEKISADKLVEEDGKDLQKYGLSSSKISIEVFGAGDKSYKLFLGDKVPTGEGFYIMLDGSSKVYLVSEQVGSSFLASEDTFRDKSVGTINVDELSYIKITNAISESQSTIIEMEKHEDGWNLLKPYNNVQTVSNDILSKLIQGIPNLSIDAFVEENAKDLSKYGLDKPSSEIMLKDKGSELHLIFGKTLSSQGIFFKTSDNNNVYLMDKSKIEGFYVKPFDLINKFAYLVNIAEIDKIQIQKGTEKYELKIQGDKDKPIYTINDKTIQEGKFRAIYGEVIGLTVDAEAPIDLKEENAEATFTYYLNSSGGGKTVNVKFINYNTDFYAVFVNDKCDFVMAKSSLEKVLKYMKDNM